MKGIRPKRGKIEIRYQFGGDKHTEVLDLAYTPNNVAEASRIRLERLERLKAGLSPIDEPTTNATIEPTGKTFGEVAQELLNYAVADSTVADGDNPFRMKLSSRNTNRDILNRFWMPSLQHKRIDRIAAEDLKAALKGVVLKAKRRSNVYGACRQVFAWAEYEDDAIPKAPYVSTNPALTFATGSNRKRKRRKKAAPDAYKAEARDALLTWLRANAPIGTYVFYLVAFYTGMRTGELLALTWADYDGESLDVTKARVRSRITTTKTEETRKVLLPAWVCKQLNALPSRFKQREIFLNGYGEPYMRAAHLTEYFERAHEKTGVRRSRQPNYPWRHTYASIGLTNGLEPAFLARQLGHTLAVFYSTYATWIDTEGDQERVERVFAEPDWPATGPLTT